MTLSNDELERMVIDWDDLEAPPVTRKEMMALIETAKEANRLRELETWAKEHSPIIEGYCFCVDCDDPEYVCSFCQLKALLGPTQERTAE